MGDGFDCSPPHAAHSSCHSPNTPRRFTLGASNVYLVGKKPDVLRPGIVGVRGYVYGHTTTTMLLYEHTHPRPQLTVDKNVPRCPELRCCLHFQTPCSSVRRKSTAVRCIRPGSGERIDREVRLGSTIRYDTRWSTFIWGRRLSFVHNRLFHRTEVRNA